MITIGTPVWVDTTDYRGWALVRENEPNGEVSVVAIDGDVMRVFSTDNFATTKPLPLKEVSINDDDGVKVTFGYGYVKDEESGTSSKMFWVDTPRESVTVEVSDFSEIDAAIAAIRP